MWVTTVTQQTKSPNLFASFLHLIVIKILKYWSDFRHIKKKNYSGNLFSADLSSFLFHVSFLWFYFSLIFLHWLKEFWSCKELWLTFILMISFPSYGLVRPELEKVLCCLLTELGIPVPLPPQPLSCSGSSASHFSLHSTIFLCSQFVYRVLLRTANCCLFVIPLWLVCIRNLLPPALL